MSQEDGMVEMVLDIRDGKVVQRFKEPMLEVIYDPPNMVDIARTMTDMAFEADTSMKPVGDTLKAELIERHRMVLTQRVANILNTVRNNPKITNGQAAQDIVDKCLSEIF